MSDNITFKILTSRDIAEMAILGQQLHPKLTLAQVENYLTQMFTFSNYVSFGVFLNHKLVGTSSAWTTIRLYSGKQLEVDNVIIDNTLQSKGIGKKLFEYIETWARERDYQTVELNTYVQNSKSHKFYFNQGYSILGFHFGKRI